MSAVVDYVDYAGKSEAEATAVAVGDGFTVRIIGRDGIPYIVTRDYKVDRINFRIHAGVVVYAERG